MPSPEHTTTDPTQAPTFMRALAAALDPWESVGTLETEYEVFLHEQNRPREPIALEARPGPGELGPNGRRAGAITLEDLFEHMLRFNLNRAQQGDHQRRCAGSER
jgi:pilus assembly protein CpaF